MSQTVYVLVTVTEGEPDMYGDVLGVFTDHKIATGIAEQIRRGENPPNMDIEAMAPFETVMALEFPLDELIRNY